MANRTVSAELQIKAADRTGRVLQQIGGKLSRLDKQATMIGKRHAVIAGTAMRAQTAAIAAASRLVAPAAIAYGIGKAVRAYASLEDGLVDLQIVSGATDEQIKRLRKTLEAGGPGIGVASGELAGVTQELVAAGMDIDRAEASTLAVGRTAKAYAASSLDVAKAANAVMQQFGVTVDELPRAFDVMATGGKLGMFELKDMAGEFPALTASATKLGYEGVEGIARLTAELETVRKGAGSSAEAANNLLNAFEKIYDPSTIKNFGKFNINLVRMLERTGEAGENQFAAVLDAIEDMTKGMSDAQRAARIAQLFPDRQARAAIQMLLRYRDENLDAFRQLMNASGTVEKDLALKLDTLSSKWDQMSAAANRAATRLGENLAPAIKDVADGMNEALDSVEQRQGGLAGWLSNEVFLSREEADNRAFRRDPRAYIRGKRLDNAAANLLFGRTPAGMAALARQAEGESMQAYYQSESARTGLPVEAIAPPSPQGLSDARARLAGKRSDLLSAEKQRDYLVGRFGEGHMTAGAEQDVARLGAEVNALAEAIERMSAALSTSASPAAAPAAWPPLPRARPVPFPRTRPDGSRGPVPLPRERPGHVGSAAADAASAEQEFSDAGRRAMASYTNSLRAEGNKAIAEAKRIKAEITRIMAQPVNPNMSLARGGVRANVGMSMPDLDQ